MKQQAAEVRADKERRYLEKQKAPPAEGADGADSADRTDADLEGFVPVDIYNVQDISDIGNFGSKKRSKENVVGCLEAFLFDTPVLSFDPCFLFAHGVFLVHCWLLLSLLISAGKRSWELQFFWILGDGEPLFANFTFEDWALLNLRFEVAVLMQSFRQDVSDPERPGIHESHLAFYYNRYFRKPLNFKFFGVSTVAELCDLVKDVVSILENGILSPVLSEDQLSNHLDLLLRHTEEARQERQRRIEAGEEGARLKFSPMAQQMNQAMQWGAKSAPPKPWGPAPGMAQSPGAWPTAQPVAARPGFVGRPPVPGARAWAPAYGGKGWGGGFPSW